MERRIPRLLPCVSECPVLYPCADVCKVRGHRSPSIFLWWREKHRRPSLAVGHRRLYGMYGVDINAATRLGRNGGIAKGRGCRLLVHQHAERHTTRPFKTLAPVCFIFPH